MNENRGRQEAYDRVVCHHIYSGGRLLINRFGEEKTAAAGIILMGTSFVLFLYMYNIPSSIVFMAVISAGVGLMRPSM